MGEENLHHF
jgi:hypothetical protein